MRVSQAPLSSTLAFLLGASLTQAQYLINELSFGYSGSISPNNDGHVPNFVLQGQPNQPEILSNKIILTPVAPGNQRGSIWSTQQVTHNNWIADIDFRANGPERAGGNLNIWLTHGGANDVGMSSAYTVGRFDGLVLVIDGHGGTGGMVRGFLNDRSTDYKARSDISSLAFGHCQYQYRNLGRPSQIKLRQTSSVFKVEIDGRLCFETDKVKIPTGYSFGITAASADNPDSFEIFKMVVMAESLQTDNAHQDHSKSQQHQQEQQHQAHEQKSNQGQPSVKNPRGPVDPAKLEILPDTNADTITSSKAQFADLHNRLQSINHQIGTIYSSVNQYGQHAENRHAETSKILDSLRQELRRLEKINDLEGRINGLEREIRAMRTDLNLQMKNTEHSLKGYMSDHHATLSSNIVNAAPGHGKLILVIVGSQIVLAIGYVVYKRKKNAMPKKYL
ncbi:lectin family integral membrane protein [Colletotrichum truncatum]|uniref:Lectin family integral membrane protein n=1 Tax=Colletotrichum truncatum TaxID=5467 RepID=A0ACC3YJ64_COLTU|nr:lectin family integral membrane protein [Colletotrichum truncatum]KAF6797197.1 lectin family integral membrane protein [Colletotrichum truncatum]